MPAAAWGRTMGVYARNAVGDQRRKCEVRPAYLDKRSLLDRAKVLVVSAEDDWLNRFIRNIGEPFARSVRELGFSAMVGPNLWPISTRNTGSGWTTEPSVSSSWSSPSGMVCRRSSTRTLRIP